MYCKKNTYLFIEKIYLYGYFYLFWARWKKYMNISITYRIRKLNME